MSHAAGDVHLSSTGPTSAGGSPKSLKLMSKKHLLGMGVEAGEVVVETFKIYPVLDLTGSYLVMDICNVILIIGFQKFLWVVYLSQEYFLGQCIITLVSRAGALG